MSDIPIPPGEQPLPEALTDDYDPTEKGAPVPVARVTLDEAFLRVVANDLHEESGFDPAVGDRLNIYGEQGPLPILPDDFDLDAYFERYDV